jgi:hypothetical protein
MAARTAKPSLEQQERTRAAIQTTQLVKRLQHYALGQNDENDNPVDLDTGKLRAIEILLRKSLPDLSSITLQGDEDNPLRVINKIEREIVRPKNPDG